MLKKLSKAVLISLIASLILMVFKTNAQNIPSVKVETASANINGIRYSGIQVRISLDKSMVVKAWEKKLKDFVDVSKSRGVYEQKERSPIEDICEDYVVFLSTIETNKDAQTVFVTLDFGEGKHLKEGDSGYEKLQKILHNFAVTLYREDVNQQIEETEDEIESTVKSYDRAVSDAENLSKKIEKNESTIEDNKKEIKELEQEIIDYKKKIEDKKGEQKNLLDEIDRLRKIAEEKKDKLSKIK